MNKQIKNIHSDEQEIMFRDMVIIRVFEQKLLELFSLGEIMGTTHTCIGQESNAVGVAMSLGESDIIVSNHRGHGHYIAHTGDVDGLMAEIMGKATGVCGGWGGSQHLCVPQKFYSNGIQGGTAPLGVGLSLSQKIKKNGNIVAIFIGDGTLGQGVLYESLNLAALHSAPIVFVVEANGIAQTTLTATTLAGTIPGRADAFGIPWKELSYPGPIEVKEGISELIDRARSGNGPGVLVIESARLGAHSKGDDTRSEDQLLKLRKSDPLLNMEAILPQDVVAKAWHDARILVERAVTAARSAAFPTCVSSHQNPSFDLIDVDHLLLALDGKAQREVLSNGLKNILSSNSRTLLLGEDITDPSGGAFKVTSGLSTSFPDQVWPMPISEAAMVGVAGGLALGGVKTIVEIMFGDFIALTSDQLINHLSRYNGMYNNQVSVPALIRTPMGGRRGYGPTHSQSLEKHFLGIQGLQVIAPSPLHSSDELMFEALNDGSPTLFIENKLAYGYRVCRSEANMVGDFYIKQTKGDFPPWMVLSLTEFEDEQATIITYGGMLPFAMDAAHKALIDDDFPVRVLVPCRLSPLDHAPLKGLLADNGSVLTVEEAHCEFGFGSEVAAVLMDVGRKCFRLGAKNMTIAASSTLEDQILPSLNDIYQAIIELREHV